jgi:ABC-2 type transport system permease protein
MFPFDGMPTAARRIAELLPLTHFVRLVRGIVLRGAGVGEMMTEIYALLAFFALAMGLAVLRFRKRLD